MVVSIRTVANPDITGFGVTSGWPLILPGIAGIISRSLQIFFLTLALRCPRQSEELEKVISAERKRWNISQTSRNNVELQRPDASFALEELNRSFHAQNPSCSDRFAVRDYSPWGYSPLTAMLVAAVIAPTSRRRAIQAESIALPHLRHQIQLLVTTGEYHIYAKNEADLFFAQGFYVARFRFSFRLICGAVIMGQLAEVFGPAYVEQDRATRLFLYRGDIKEGVERLWSGYRTNVPAIRRRH